LGSRHFLPFKFNFLINTTPKRNVRNAQVTVEIVLCLNSSKTTPLQRPY